MNRPHDMLDRNVQKSCVGKHKGSGTYLDVEARVQHIILTYYRIYAFSLDIFSYNIPYTVLYSFQELHL